ncbi:MAG: adenine deaminase [Tepidisphaeraceae bacterium]
MTPRHGIHHLLRAARGDTPAELLLRNARIVNVFSGEIEDSDIAIFGGMIAGIGTGYSATETIDLAGAYVAPGLIDAHVHIESSLCLPAQFAAAIVPRGVTTVVADPHEIANVAGAAAVRFMADASRGLPLRVILMASSCVPATELATAGAKLTAEDLEQLLKDGVVHGLAEVMNFPGVIHGEADVLRKLAAFHGRPVDGHAPGVSGTALNAYVAAGVGSDHECVTVEEAKEKLARGMYVLIREATNARNLDALLPLINSANSRRICFCTDDRTPPDLLEQGSIDDMLRRAIEFGIDPITAIRCCTLNTAEWFGLRDRGAIAPGRVADLFVFRDLKSPRAERVFSAGKFVTPDVEAFSRPAHVPAAMSNTCRIALAADAFRIPARGNRMRVIGSLRDQLITESRTVAAMIVDGQAIADPARDVLKMAVVDRHGGSGRIGLGFIQGFGLQRGAIAGTFAHDHHNLVVIGCDDVSMTTAVRAVADMHGGLAVASGDRALATLGLSVAGLMSDRPIAEVADGYRTLLAAAKQLGSTLHDPFGALSFMALEVIPTLKLTDRGLVDVDAQRIVDLFV